MVKDGRDYPLIKQLEHYNLEFLIPLHFNSDDDEAEGYCHTYSNMDHAVLDPTEDAYYDEMFDEDDEYNDAFEEEQGVVNLDDLCRIFNADYLEYLDLLNMNIWDLFGITKKQFDMIDWNELPPSEFISFYNIFIEEKRDLPVEKRILYSLADAVTDYRSIASIEMNSPIVQEDRINYMEHIIDTHTMNETRDLISLLSDYWRFLPDAVVMNGRRERAHEDVFNYIDRPKPSHIRDLHNKAFRDHMSMETERMAENRKRLTLEIRRVSNSQAYKKFLYTDGRYIVRPVTCQDDLDYEGEYLNHCVATYGSYMARMDSFIYLVRTAKDQETPFFTAEIVPPSKRGERYKLNQLYTFKDSTEKTQEFRDFVKDWAQKKGFAIKCRV